MGEGFKQNYQVTIGADFAVKRITDGDELYLFQIWDLSAQVAFKSIRNIYYKHTNGVILTYDLTSIQSYENLHLWIKEFTASTNTTNVPGIIVGNKVDLQSDLDFTKSDIIADPFTVFKRYLGTTPQFYKTSALDGTNVDRMFNALIKLLIDTM